MPKQDEPPAIPDDGMMGGSSMNNPNDEMMPPNDEMNNGQNGNMEQPLNNQNNNSQEGNQNQYNTNFDAGVDADPDEDPEHYIQQLTGKLSQELNKYNQNNQQPDVSLNKYVGGMILKQVTKGLSPNDIKKIIDDFKNGEDNDENSDNDDFENENGGDMNDEMDGNTDQNDDKMMESYKHRINELFNGILKNGDEEKGNIIGNIKKKNTKSYNTKPFRK